MTPHDSSEVPAAINSLVSAAGIDSTQQIPMLASVLDASADHIAVTDREGRYLYVNRAGAAIAGLMPEEVLGHTPRELGIPEEFIALFARQRETVFATGNPFHGFIRYNTAQGLRDFEYSFTAMPTDTGRIEAIVGVARDITERIQLVQAERERSKQLATAIQEVHHRVKNSLQSVLSLLELQIDPESDMVPVEAFQNSLRQIRTIALVYDLLARDKPIGNVNVAQMLARLVALMAESLRISDEPLPATVEAEPIWMPTKQATSLALVVNELLTNAAKHNRAPNALGVSYNPALAVRLRGQEGAILVTVEDYGPGFPLEFDVKRDARVGLQLVCTLVEHDLRGEIAFTNRAEADGSQGARIEIRFPGEYVAD